jgi:FkbM family methyltransferase
MPPIFSGQVSLKRRLIDAVVGPLGIQISRRGSAWALIEPEQLSRFLREFRVDCVFDVGANTGQYASRLRHIGFTGLIISFEPIPEAAAKIAEAARHDRAWIVKQLAMDSRVRTVHFNVMKDSQFSSLHEPDHSSTAAFADKNRVEQTLPVETQTIANLYPLLQAEHGFSRPFLKLDTQGHDVDVVQGADAYIGRFVGLQSELGLTTLYKGSKNFHEALDYYQKLGFKLSALIPNNAGAFPDLNEVDCLMYNPAYRQAASTISSARG